MSAADFDVNVASCVADIISAFHDGGVVIERIKLKRADERAPPPSRLLEESVDQAPDEITKEKDRCRSSTGQAFEDGDPTAIIALQKITIELQKSLLDKLKSDDAEDLSSLVEAADLGREKTLSALRDLQSRLEARSRSTQETARNYLGSQSSAQPPTPAMRVEFDKDSLPPKAPSPSGGRSSANSRDPSGDEGTASAGAEYTVAKHGRKRGSLLGFLNRHHRSDSGSNDRIPTLEEEGRRSSPINGSLRSRIGEAFSPSQEAQDDIWSSRPSSADHRRESVIVAPGDISRRHSRNGSIPSGKTGEIMAPTPNTPNLGASAIPNPTPENNYLGFCKHAFKLQTGDRKALQKSKEFNDGWSQSVVYYLACGQTKCAFAGHIALDAIWDKVWIVESKGVQFRWPFLAKSHVLQQKVKDRVYQYQCIICVLSGDSSPIFNGTDEYIDHLQHHRNEGFGEVLLYKTKMVAGRVAEDSEEFDVNLWPGDVVRQSSVTSPASGTEVAAGKGSPSEDSAFAGVKHPWNEGLSDFHWKDDFS